jgi:WhiB family redox-sensing transcriptional regulator
MDWRKLANCRSVNPDIFFPERGGTAREAKAICAGCEVRQECLDYAFAHHEKFGVWGGMAERERRRYRRSTRVA